MKKILFVLLLAIACTGCDQHKPGYHAGRYTKEENAIYGWEYLDTDTKYRTVTIKGHEYIMFKSDWNGVIAVVHSESCNCKNKKK